MTSTETYSPAPTSAEAITSPAPMLVDKRLYGETAAIPSTAFLPEEHPLTQTVREYGVAGQVMAGLKMGDQMFAILDISQTPDEQGFHEPFTKRDVLKEKTPHQFSYDEDRPLLLVQISDQGTIVGRAIRSERTMRLGRDAGLHDARSKRFDYEHDDLVSRDHASISLDPATGDIMVTDRNSTNGTLFTYATNEISDAQRETVPYVPISDPLPTQRHEALPSTEATQLTVPNYEKAAAVEPDELWRDKNNGGRSMDSAYIEAHRASRQRLVEAFRSGQLYRSTEDFVGLIQREHRLLAEDHYVRLNPGKELFDDEIGAFRDNEGRPFRPYNNRVHESLALLPIAAHYNDPYAASDRFDGGTPDGYANSFVELPGISHDNLPYDVLHYDGEGKPSKMVRGYEFYYPDAAGLGEYMTQIQQTGQHIQQAMESGSANTDEVLDMVARQYQYAANARPFAQVNNSLFMDLANMQIKMLGFDGVTHSNMDIAAQRLQPENFARYFADRVKGMMP